MKMQLLNNRGKGNYKSNLFQLQRSRVIAKVHQSEEQGFVTNSITLFSQHLHLPVSLAASPNQDIVLMELKTNLEFYVLQFWQF
jgi:hypothetical protein